METESNSPVLIVGTGALASLFAARLVASGTQVSMLGTWEAGLNELRKSGVRLLGPDRVERVYPVRVAETPAEVRGAQLALVLVKAWQTERASHQLADCLADDGLALTLQNGLGNREILARELGNSRVALGVTTTGATLLGPGQVRPGGEGIISIEAHERLPQLERLLRQAGFAVDIVPDARALVWGKLVINAAINPLTALLQIPNGVLVERPAASELMKMLAQETAAVAIKLGVSLPFSDAPGAAEEVARRTAGNHSSMYQDVRRGAPTEIDAICGAIVTEGERQGVPTPANRVMWNLVRARVQGTGE